MLISLKDADIGLLYKELLDRNFHNLYIYKQKRDLLVLYLKNLGVKYIEIQ